MLRLRTFIPRHCALKTAAILGGGAYFYNYVAENDPTISIHIGCLAYCTRWDTFFSENEIRVSVDHRYYQPKRTIISCKHNGLNEFLEKYAKTYTQDNQSNEREIILVPSNGKWFDKKSFKADLEKAPKIVETEVEFINHWGLKKRKVFNWIACVE